VGGAPLAMPAPGFATAAEMLPFTGGGAVELGRTFCAGAPPIMVEEGVAAITEGLVVVRAIGG
jgi:hypothetical protein